MTAINSQAIYWWTGTALDLQYLGPENIANLANLAKTPKEFYEKYVMTNNKDQLMMDVLTALNTTESYAQDFATKVSGYFANDWYSHNQQLFQQLPPVPSQLPQPPAPAEHTTPAQYPPVPPAFNPQSTSSLNVPSSNLPPPNPSTASVTSVPSSTSSITTNQFHVNADYQPPAYNQSQPHNTYQQPAQTVCYKNFYFFF